MTTKEKPIQANLWQSMLSKNHSQVIDEFDEMAKNQTRVRFDMLINLIAINSTWDTLCETGAKFSEWLSKSYPEISSAFWSFRKGIDLLISFENGTRSNPDSKNLIVRDLLNDYEARNVIFDLFVLIGEKRLSEITECADSTFSMEIIANLIHQQPGFSYKDMRYLVSHYNFKTCPRIKTSIDFQTIKTEADFSLRSKIHAKDKEHYINKTFLGFGINHETDKLFDLSTSFGMELKFNDGKLFLSSEQIAELKTDENLTDEVKKYSQNLINQLNLVLGHFINNLTR